MFLKNICIENPFILFLDIMKTFNGKIL